MPRLKRRGDRDGPAAAGDRPAETDGSANLGAAAGGEFTRLAAEHPADSRFGKARRKPRATTGAAHDANGLPGRQPEVSGLPRTWGLAKGGPPRRCGRRSSSSTKAGAAVTGNPEFGTSGPADTPRAGRHRAVSAMAMRVHVEELHDGGAG